MIRTISVARCALVLALAATAPLAACGSDRSGGTATTALGPPAARGTRADQPSRLATPVAITSPGHGLTLRGHRRGDGRQAVAVRLAGTAAQQQIVRVDGHCAARSCLRMALADMTGRWSARLLLVLPGRARHASVTARYALGSASGRAARVRLVVHPLPAAPAGIRRSRRSGASTAAAADGGDDVAGPGAGGAPSPGPSDGTAIAPAPPATAPGHGSVVVIGDSLAVGMQGSLPAALPGWSVRIDGRTGRPLAEGMQVLGATSLPPRAVLAISLFTNDDPAHVDALRAAVQRTLARVGPDGCVVWATIRRPPLDGVSYDTANALLARMAGADSRLRLVRWAETMRARPDLLRPDGVHPTPQGYTLRARLYAAAIASC